MFAVVAVTCGGSWSVGVVQLSRSRRLGIVPEISRTFSVYSTTNFLAWSNHVLSYKP